MERSGGAGVKGAGKLLADLSGYLQDELEAGGKEVEVSPDVLASLRRKSRPAAAKAGGGATAAGSAVVKDRGAVPPAGRAAGSANGPLEPSGSLSAKAAEAGSLEEVAALAARCTACTLHANRTKSVPGQGNPHPEILFVGEAPGREEDLQGLSFIGPAGQLLTKMIAAMGMTREEVFIANIAKCRPKDNRAPLPDEMAACLPFLVAQIRLLKPRIIVTLGAVATKGLLGDTPGITKIRGQWRKYGDADLMPTFHPSYLLRCPSEKRKSWEDLQEVLRKLGRTLPPVAQKIAPASRT